MSGMAEVLAVHALVVLDFDQRGGACFCGEEFEWKLPTIHSKINALAVHQAAMLTAAGFGPVKEAAAAAALEDAADAIEPLWFQHFGGRKDMNESKRTWLRARAAAVRGEG